MRSKWVLLAASALALTGAVVFLIKHRQKPLPLPRQPDAAVIQTNNEVKLSGQIRPQHVIGVGASVSGNIDAMLVDVGEDVFEGQLLARIGSSDVDTNREAATQAVERTQDIVTKTEGALNAARLEASRADADMQRARSQLYRTQAVLERQTTLHKAGATPKLAYEKAVNDYEAAVKEFEIMDRALRGARENVAAASTKANDAKLALAAKSKELEGTEGQFAATEVHAPADGVVVARKGSVGKPADESGDQMFQIATDIFALEVPVQAKPEVIKRIHTGQEATIVVLDLPSAILTGTVKEIREKEGEVVVEFGSTVPAIRPGMRADVQIRLE